MTYALLRRVAAGASLFALNATGWTALALLFGRRDQVTLGLAQMVSFGLGGALAGLAFHVFERAAGGGGAVRRYGPWLSAGVTAMFALVPLQAVHDGTPVAREVALFVGTPWMVLFYTIAGALGGYVAGRELGFLQPPWHRP